MRKTSKSSKVFHREGSSFRFAFEADLDTLPWPQFQRKYCTEYLGRGIARDVWLLNPDSVSGQDLVVKVAKARHEFSNAMEWELWRYFSRSDEQRFLAPCVDISATGDRLVMRRTYPLPARKFRGHLPKLVPTWMTDLKLSNWGLLLGNPVAVCHDYGSWVVPGDEMRKPNWWKL